MCKNCRSLIVLLTTVAVLLSTVAVLAEHLQSLATMEKIENRSSLLVLGCVVAGFAGILLSPFLSSGSVFYTSRCWS